MANLTESSVYEAGIYQLETTDPCLAGPSGVLNTPHKQLANRTKYLKDQQDSQATSIGTINTNIGLINTEVRLWREVVSIQETSGIIPLTYSDARGTIYRVGSTSVGEADYALPAANTCPAGTTVAFKHEGSSATNNVNIRRSGSNNIRHKGTNITILIMKIGDACVLVSNGVDTWNVVSYYEGNVGLITTFGMSLLPTGFLECNGAAISRTTYANLFNVIGTTFGAGNGSTTFNLPDLRGEFVRGWDNGRGADSGRVFGSAQAATGVASYGNGTSAADVFIPIQNADGSYSSSAVGGFAQKPASYTAKATETFYNVRPRNVALIFGIKF